MPGGTVRELTSPGQLRAALATLTRMARQQVADGLVPRLYTSGVRYRREGPGRERWQLPHTTMTLGTGDCEDLATWRAAETGGAAIPIRTSVGWHVVVRMPDGRIEDPSRVLGMGAGER